MRILRRRRHEINENEYMAKEKIYFAVHNEDDFLPRQYPFFMGLNK